MARDRKNSGPLVIFYVLVAYVCVQFCWWGYHIYELNSEIYSLKVSLQTTESAREQRQELNKKLANKRWMVIGEGSVFLSLLVLGALKTRSAFRKELSLSKQQKNFLLSVTHELKSPIASVKLYLQTLLKREISPEQSKEIIQNAIKESERLGKLVDNILLATNIENSTHIFDKHREDLSQCIEDVAATARALAHQHLIKTDIQKGITSNFDKDAICSIVLNLVENAIKYSPPTSAISIGLHAVGDDITLSVKDEGIGIESSERAHIFQKFYRAENEETRKSKGTGLGLYIVEYLVSQHNGAIEIKENYPHGTIFEVKLTSMG